MSRDVRRAVIAGLSGTAAMTTTMRLERLMRSVDSLPVDYDATDHVVTAASAVLHRTPRTDCERRALFLAVHWGYGSGVAVGYRLLRRLGLRPVPAALTFGTACQGMAFTMFPLLGGTPPPWRWRRDVVASSLVQHAVYVAVVAAADHMLTDSV